jgi:hypothetical protein
MERTQISLTAEQGARLRRIAQRRGVSMASLIRDAVDSDAPDRAEQWRRAMAAVGAFRSDGGPVSREHDRYLEDAFVDWHDTPR